jgi:hypothetical protein
MPQTSDGKKARAEREKPQQKQIRADKEMLRALKVHAAQRGVTLNTVYDEAMVEFLRDRKAEVKEGQGEVSRTFYASPGEDAEPFNVALTPSQMEIARKTAEKDKVTTTRVIYTALVKYLQRRRLIR